MKEVLAGLFLLGALSNQMWAGGDDFHGSLLDQNKWGYVGGGYSQNFVHTNGVITFESSNETEGQWGYIYWKEKMSLTSNWNAKIQTYINPTFLSTNSSAGYGNIQTGIGVSDSLTTATNSYFNTFLKESYAGNHNYFNPNYNINSDNNVDAQKSLVYVDKVLLELDYNASSGFLTAKMFDFSSNSLGVVLGSDSFAVSQWGSVNEVYVVVGGNTVDTLAQQGTATLDNFEIIPEPSALSLLAVGLGVLFRRSRKRD